MNPVIAIHDLCGLGHSSLAVALPVLSVTGRQVLCAPTAVLSSQTDGYTDYTNVDLSDTLPQTLRHWQKEDVLAAAVYSGYLAHPAQINDVRYAIEHLLTPGGIALIDPVLGDEGALYDTMTPAFVSAMQDLLQHATVITPNATEFRALLGLPLHAPLPERELPQALAHLAEKGPGQIIVTSYGEAKDHVSTVIYDHAAGLFQMHQQKRLPGHFPGTGDLYASVLLSALLQDIALPDAARDAGVFVAQAIALALEAGRPAREGVPFEQLLPKLCPSV